MTRDGEDGTPDPVPADPDNPGTDRAAQGPIGRAGELARDAAADAAAAVGFATSAASQLSKAVSSLGRAPLQGAAGIAGRVAAPVAGSARTDTPSDLRERGSDLISRGYDFARPRRETQPAFGRMLEQMSPDEARILRFLAVAGQQPAIDVRTKTLFQVGSQLLAGGINLIARMAGCRYPERDRQYLANLNRLGLVRFSTEPVADYRRYALLEVQPESMEAMARTKRSISIYRSIELSVLGEEFCESCFDTEGYNAGGWDTDPRRDKIVGRIPPGVGRT